LFIHIPYVINYLVNIHPCLTRYNDFISFHSSGKKREFSPKRLTLPVHI
jgi:hypothetical protein